MIQTAIVRVNPKDFSATNDLDRLQERYDVIDKNTRPFLFYHIVIGIIGTLSLYSCTKYIENLPNAIIANGMNIKDAEKALIRTASLGLGSLVLSTFSGVKMCHHFNALHSAKEEIASNLSLIDGYDHRKNLIKKDTNNLVLELTKAQTVYDKNMGFSLARLLFPVKYEFEK